MKNSKTLTELAAVLEDRKARKHDVIVDDREITVLTGEDGTEVSLRPGGNTIATLDPQRLFVRQLGQHIGVRADLMDRLQATHPAQFDGLVNGLLGRMHIERDQKAQQHMVRTYLPGGDDGGNGVARALLGKGYRRIDNDEVAEAVLPVILEEMPGAEVAACELTETKMYIKVLAGMQVNLKDLIRPGLHGMLPEGPDTVQAGFVLTNSEVGAASFTIEHMLYRLVCTNGLIVSKAMSRRHVGARQVNVAEDFTIFSDETQKQSDRALMMQIADTVRHTLNEEKFRSLASQFAQTLDTEPVEAPVEAMKVLVPKVGLSDGEGRSVLQHLLEGGNKTQFGMVNAITRAAQDVDSYDRSVEMEQIGAQVMGMGKADWATVALATA